MIKVTLNDKVTLVPAVFFFSDNYDQHHENNILTLAEAKYSCVGADEAQDIQYESILETVSKQELADIMVGYITDSDPSAKVEITNHEAFDDYVKVLDAEIQELDVFDYCLDEDY